MIRSHRLSVGPGSRSVGPGAPTEEELEGMAAVPEEEEEVRRLKLEKIRAKLGEALLDKIVKYTSGNINTQIVIHKSMLKNYDNNIYLSSRITFTKSSPPLNYPGRPG